MPLYELECRKCLSEGRSPWFEVTMPVKVHDDFVAGKRRVKCPECGGYLKNLICPPRRIKIS